MDFEAILTEAFDAASVAMSVWLSTHKEAPFNCGFSWVTIDGTEPLARHCRKMLKQGNDRGWTDRSQKVRYGDKGYPRGWQFWGPGNYMGQDMTCKTAGAHAFNEILARYNIRGTVGSRLD